MAHKHASDRSKPAKDVCTRSEKIRMSHERTRKQIQHIHAEAAGRIATGRPLHATQATRR